MTILTSHLMEDFMIDEFNQPEFDYLEWNEDESQWELVDVPTFMQEQVDLEKQVAEENNTFPKLTRVAKKQENCTEAWHSELLADHVASLSNTKYVRHATTMHNMPMQSYVIVPVSNYQCFRKGKNDYRWGSPAIFLIAPQNCEGTLGEFGKSLNQYFQMG